MKVLCSRCKGTKKFRGMGCVISICPNCNGIGFIEAAKIISDDNGIIKKRKKRTLENEDQKNEVDQ